MLPQRWTFVHGVRIVGEQGEPFTEQAMPKAGAQIEEWPSRLASRNMTIRTAERIVRLFCIMLGIGRNGF